MPKTLETLLAELRHRLSGLYGDRLAGLFLYGSQARGDAVTGSDIDVLVVLKGPVYPAEEMSGRWMSSRACLSSMTKSSTASLRASVISPSTTARSC